MYAEGAVTDWACQKWFVKFHAGDFLRDDATQSGKTVEVDSNQIEILIENNRCYTMQEIANILKISKLKKILVIMKKCVFFIMGKKHNGLFGQPNISWLFSSVGLITECLCLMVTIVTKGKYGYMPPNQERTSSRQMEYTKLFLLLGGESTRPTLE